MKTMFSYVRWSSKQQTAGDSFLRQTETARRVASEHGWRLIDLPPDGGLSAWHGANRHKGALGLFLKRVQTGEIKTPCVLLVEKLDRFSRQDIDEVLPEFINLIKNGVEVFSSIENEHYTPAILKSDPVSTVLKMLMAFYAANQFSKALSERLTRQKHGKYERAMNGELVNLGECIPFCFDYSPDGYRLNDRAETVRRIFKEYIGGKSMLGITRSLNADKIPTFRKGRGWGHSTVSKVLKDRHYIGEWRGVKYLPPVVSDETFNTVQRLLRQNKTRKGQRPSVANILRGLIYCKHCGDYMTQQTLKGTFRYFRCTGLGRGVCSHHRMIRAGELEKDLLFTVLELNVHKLSGNGDAETAVKISELETAQVAVERQIKKLVAVSDSVELDELTAKLTALKKEKNGLQEAIADLQLKMSGTAGIKKALVDLQSIVGRTVRVQDLQLDRLVDLQAALEDPETRQKLQNVMPSLIGKLTVDTDDGSYTVYNHSGEVVQTSHI